MKRLRLAAAHAWKLTLVRHSVQALAGLAALLVISGLLTSYRNFQLAQLAYLLCATAGLTVLVGLGGQISVAQGAFMMIGAYTTALLTQHLHWGLPPVLLASAAAAALVGLLIALVATRLRGIYLATLTVALAVGLPALVDHDSLSNTLQGENGLTVRSSPPPGLLGADFPMARWQACVAGLCAILTLWALANLTHSRYGRSMRAARDDDSAAALSGIHIARIRTLAFVVAAACGGLGGGLLAWVNGLAAPGAFRLNLSLGLLTAAILGGLGSLTGSLWGALLLLLISVWTSDLASANHLPTDLANNLPGAIYGIILIVTMTVLPGGIQDALRPLHATIAALTRHRTARR